MNGFLTDSHLHSNPDLIKVRHNIVLTSAKPLVQYYDAAYHY